MAKESKKTAKSAKKGGAESETGLAIWLALCG